MIDLGKIRDLIERQLDEFKLILLEEGEEEIKPYIDEIAKKTNSANKSGLATLEPYKMFFVYFYLTNNNTLSFEEAYNVVLEVKDAVNSWNYSSNGQVLMELGQSIDDNGMVIDNKAYDCLTKLKLTPEFINYNIKSLCFIMLDFLHLKKNLMDIQFKVKGVGKSNLMNQAYNKSRIKEIMDIAMKAIKQSDKELEEDKGIAREKIKYTKEVLAKVDDSSLVSLTEIPPLWHRFLEPDLLEDLYNIVFDNLHKEVDQVDDEIIKREDIVLKDELTEYLFLKGIDIKSIDKGLLDELSKKEDITYILDNLCSIGLSLSKIFLEYGSILKNLTKDMINKIQFLVSSNVLSKDTLLKNMDLFSSKFNELLVNYEILKPIMDFDNMFYDDSILLLSTKQLKDILSILAQYNLSRNNYIYLLCHFNYLPIYDLLLEHEIPLYLFISICETKEPMNTIKRIMIYRMIGEEFETSSKLLRKEVAMEERSLIPNNELDDYLPFFVNLSKIKGRRIGKVLKSEVVKNFDQSYLVASDLYMIGGALISRPKFLRNYEEVNEDKERIMECLVSNSLLSEKEYRDVIKEFKGKRL